HAPEGNESGKTITDSLISHTLQLCRGYSLRNATLFAMCPVRRTMDVAQSSTSATFNLTIRVLYHQVIRRSTKSDWHVASIPIRKLTRDVELMH
ncbi:hypothetical protein PFISCL1PPCAC_16360, partial [Pristionchus fissidentatus]